MDLRSIVALAVVDKDRVVLAGRLHGMNAPCWRNTREPAAGVAARENRNAL